MSTKFDISTRNIQIKRKAWLESNSRCYFMSMVCFERADHFTRVPHTQCLGRVVFCLVYNVRDHYLACPQARHLQLQLPREHCTERGCCRVGSTSFWAQEKYESSVASPGHPVPLFILLMRGIRDMICRRLQII